MIYFSNALFHSRLYLFSFWASCLFQSLIDALPASNCRTDGVSCGFGGGNYCIDFVIQNHGVMAFRVFELASSKNTPRLGIGNRPFEVVHALR